MRRAADFLESIGVNSAIAARGETLHQTIASVEYLGIRWIRSGTESRVSVDDLIELHQATGVRYSWSPGSGGADLPKLLESARKLAKAGALFAFEGPNEPNNWPITYRDRQGGGNKSWQPVADFQHDLYNAVRADPVLHPYPVWGVSETGAETDNVGLQFLRVPKGAGAAVPDGTAYADFANVHNYIYHPNAPGLEDNKTWMAADPSPACRVDGLYGNHGSTWAHHFAGYSEADLARLPRVTTETGTTIGGPVTEEIQALNLLSLYLDQFKRGWSATAVYLLRDRSDESGNQTFGFYDRDDHPRKAAVYLHNLTTILEDRAHKVRVGSLTYSIDNEPATMHDMLLQKNDGALALIVWSERVSGTSQITVNLGKTCWQAEIFDPTVGVQPIRTARAASAIPLVLSDHPVVVLLAGADQR